VSVDESDRRGGYDCQPHEFVSGVCCICHEAARLYKPIDPRDDSEPLGGPLREGNPCVGTYAAPMKGNKLIADLAVGESSACEYRLSGERGIYRVLRIS
jgi:hypothetical protein